MMVVKLAQRRVPLNFDRNSNFEAYATVDKTPAVP